MAGGGDIRPSQAGSVSIETMSPKHKQRLQELCIERGLCYNHSPLPLCVSPGVFMFYATPLTMNCTRHGHCRQLTFYAVVKGEHIYINP